MTQELAGIDGKEGTMVMVEYAPGGSRVVMQVKGGNEMTLGPGQTL